ncbi:MAG: SGNH/GDSL hydrolase family protein [Actinobacteria bacterium]|nr:SGNH/GDSL hydrolase family protein [Actinomycetota bacterium]
MSPRWRSFVALGDSLTEGVGDPLPAGRLRGWAERLADILRAAEPDLAFTNLARRSLVTREIRDTQLAPALEMEPDLAAAIVGMNDAIRPAFDLANVAGPLDEMVGRLSDSGTTVLLSTLPDITRVLPLPRRMTRALHGRLGAVSEAVREVTGRHRGTILVDADEDSGELRRANLSLDQLHPNSRGHSLIAIALAQRLAERSGVELPLAPPGRVRAAGLENARHARWLLDNVGVPEARRLAGRVLGPRQRPE